MRQNSPRLPKRFPVGTTYVVEGRAEADGLFHVSSRYVVMPNGCKVTLPIRALANIGCAPSIVPRRPRSTERRARAEAPVGA